MAGQGVYECGCEDLLTDGSFNIESETSLGSSDTASASAVVAETLTSITFSLEFSGTGTAYPADLMAYIYAPDAPVWFGVDGTSIQTPMKIATTLGQVPTTRGPGIGVPRRQVSTRTL